ncbi:MAG TPA: pyrroline-5-carboxylate reductase [Luteibaculaceae bacterium]|nr:pyrroline-5-carboxylate reductase [Luteibaculaceae bacterium]
MGDYKIGFIGAGNIGLSLIKGLIKAEFCRPEQIVVSRRDERKAEELRVMGLEVSCNSSDALKAQTVVLAVLPQQLDTLILQIKANIRPGQLFVSVISGVSCAMLRDKLGSEVDIVRAMPNTAIAIGESMTTLAADRVSEERMKWTEDMFKSVGSTLVIAEELMTSATALCACGIAFFLRSIRAASQGGVEIGFHAEEAIYLAAQTAKGAAALLLANGSHPEHEIDKVTSPKGCTIAGLNEMEHRGFSSSMIKGIRLSADKAGGLYE